jgi:acyl-CoA synthetase (AMP-forming)/AMP-acid ligase II
VTVFSRNADAHPGAMAFEQLLAAEETPAVMQAFAQVLPDTHAKYLLTSGSTGKPKVVVNTHRMLCANQQMMAQTWRFLRTKSRCWSTGCRGATPSAPTTTCTWCCATAARSTSTRGGPRRG